MTLFREGNYFHMCWFSSSALPGSTVIKMRLFEEKLREHDGSHNRNMDPLSCTVEV